MPLPPGPDLPSWRQAQAWIDRPLEFWEECAAQFGDTFTVQLGSTGPTVLFSHPDAVHQIFQLPPEAFRCRQFNEPYEYLMGPQSPFVSDGAPHRRRRQFLAPPFQREQVTAYAPVVRDLTRRAVAAWPVGEVFSPRLSVHLLSLEVLLHVVFGGRDEDVGREIVELFRSEVLRDFGAWRPWTRFGRLQPRWRELIARALHRRRQQPDGDGLSLLDVLVRAEDGTGRPLGDEEIQDQVLTLLIAGVDPVAVAVLWALYWLHELPAVRAEVVRELAKLGEGRADPVRVAQLPYLSAVCHEALRISPVLPTPSGRKLTRPAEVRGQAFEAKTTLLPCTYLVHRREDLYPDARSFRPERFLQRQFARHEYFPFGGGTRLCLGAWLAPLEMKLMVATILACWDSEAAHEGPVTPVRHGTLLAPSEPMRLLVTGPARATADCPAG
jgi:unspecific monooxygenase